MSIEYRCATIYNIPIQNERGYIMTQEQARNFMKNEYIKEINKQMELTNDIELLDLLCRLLWRSGGEVNA